MSVNLADFNPVVPIIILWVVVALLGKKKQATRRGTSASPGDFSPGPGPDPSSSAMSGEAATELARALEALKAAEDSARHPRPAGAMHDVPPRHAQAPGLMPDQAARARAYLETRKAQARLHQARQPQREVFHPKARARLVLEDDSAESQDAAEGDTTDFDDEAVRIADARLKEAEEFSRVLAPDESRRLTARPAAAPAPGAPAARPAPAPAGNVLSRFATGRLRDAVILGEILGRPIGERPPPR